MESVASTSRDQFLQLLVAQLRHQDPIEPVKQEQFLGQLAQFSTLEGVEELNANFEQLLKLQELTQGAQLIGQEARYVDPDTGQTETGQIEEVTVTGSSTVLVINNKPVSLDQVEALVANV